MTERIRRDGRWFFEEAVLAYNVEYHRATVESVRDECPVYQFRALGRRPRLYRSRRWTVLQVLWHYTGQYCEYIAWPRSILFPFTLGPPLSPISRAGARYIFMYTTWEDVKRRDVRSQEWKSTKIKGIEISKWNRRANENWVTLVLMPLSYTLRGFFEFASPRSSIPTVIFMRNDWLDHEEARYDLVRSVIFTVFTTSSFNSSLLFWFSRRFEVCMNRTEIKTTENTLVPPEMW